MIKNIIFDMGNVLIHYEPAYFIERAGITDPEEKELLMRNVFSSYEWSRLDRGSLHDEEAISLMCSKLPQKLHPVVEELVSHWNEPIIPMEGMSDLIRELKENGYMIYLLSNASYRLRAYFDNIPGSEYFDALVVSAEELLVKPQPEIYKLICDRYDLQPEECVFVDDFNLNAEGAFCCGIHPIVFHQDVDELREKLIELGVRVRK